MQLASNELTTLLASLSDEPIKSERRGDKRVALATRGIVRAAAKKDGGREQTFSVLTRDIGIAGLGLIAAAPIERGLCITIELAGRENKRVTLHGKVQHCRAMADGLWSIGVEFSHSSEAG